MRDLNILIVDYNIQSLTYLTDILLNRVNNIYCASNGWEGINIVKKYKIDILITDYEMPNLNGLKMIKAINNLKEKNISINLMLKKNQKLDKNRQKEYKINSILYEPISHKAILKLLNIDIDINQKDDLNILNYLKDKNKIMLFNSYKGLLISYFANLKHIGVDGVIFEVNHHQLKAISISENTFFNFDTKLIEAKGEVISTFDNLVKLKNFEVVDSQKFNRETLRVELNKNIDVEVQSEKSIFYGYIEDISLKSTSLILKHKSLLLGINIKLNINLNGEILNINASTQKVDFLKDREEYKYIIYFNLIAKEENILGKYLLNLQNSIIKELENININININF